MSISEIYKFKKNFRSSSYFYRFPELGIRGSHIPEDNLSFLSGIFENKKLTVLDLGAAEAGCVYLYKDKIKTYHGFEKEVRSVIAARKMFDSFNLDSRNFIIKTIKLGHQDLYKKYSDFLLKKYELVCFLGFFHKLFFTKKINSKKVKNFYKYKKNIFFISVNVCKKYYAIHTSLKCLEAYGIFDYMEQKGFRIKYKENVDIKDRKTYCYIIWEK